MNMKWKYYLILGIIVILGIILISDFIKREGPGPIVDDRLILYPDGTSILQGQDCPTVPPLIVFGEASVIAETLGFKLREADIEINIRITSLPSYTLLKSPEILLNVGDMITINFVGAGNSRMWKVMELLEGVSYDCGELTCPPECSLKKGRCDCLTVVPRCPKGFILVNETAPQGDKSWVVL